MVAWRLRISDHLLGEGGIIQIFRGIVNKKLLTWLFFVI
ncbi:hypothetical protein EMIT053CA3_90182 [Pseudomonas donghuensis]